MGEGSIGEGASEGGTSGGKIVSPSEATYIERSETSGKKMSNTINGLGLTTVKSLQLCCN